MKTIDVLALDKYLRTIKLGESPLIGPQGYYNRVKRADEKEPISGFPDQVELETAFRFFRQMAEESRYTPPNTTKMKAMYPLFESGEIIQLVKPFSKEQTMERKFKPNFNLNRPEPSLPEVDIKDRLQIGGFKPEPKEDEPAKPYQVSRENRFDGTTGKGIKAQIFRAMDTVDDFVEEVVIRVMRNSLVHLSVFTTIILIQSEKFVQVAKLAAVLPDHQLPDRAVFIAAFMFESLAFMLAMNSNRKDVRRVWIYTFAIVTFTVNAVYHNLYAQLWGKEWETMAVFIASAVNSLFVPIVIVAMAELLVGKIQFVKQPEVRKYGRGV